MLKALEFRSVLAVTRTSVCLLGPGSWMLFVSGALRFYTRGQLGPSPFRTVAYPYALPAAASFRAFGIFLVSTLPVGSIDFPFIGQLRTLPGDLAD